MSDGMSNIGKIGQPMEWSTDRAESPKQSEEVANRSAFGSRETKKPGRKRKNDTFLKRKADSRKLGPSTTSLSKRSAQKTNVIPKMQAGAGKYDTNEVCIDYQSKLLSAKSYLEVKELKNELEDIMANDWELFTEYQRKTLSTLVLKQEVETLMHDIDHTTSIERLPRIKAHTESLKDNNPSEDFSHLDGKIGKKFTDIFMAKMKSTETLEELEKLHITLEEMREELELGHSYPPRLKKNLGKKTKEILDSAQEPKELIGFLKVINIMNDLDNKRVFTDSLNDKPTQNSTEWAESEAFAAVTQELISIYKRMELEIDDESELNEINEKTTELSNLLPPPNMENFSDRIRNTTSATELHLLRNHLSSKKDHYDENDYKDIKDMIYQRLGELALTQYSDAENLDDLLENAEEILKTLINERPHDEMLAKTLLTTNPLLNDILDGKLDLTPQESEKFRKLVRSIRNSINQE